MFDLVYCVPGGWAARPEWALQGSRNPAHQAFQQDVLQDQGGVVLYIVTEFRFQALKNHCHKILKHRIANKCFFRKTHFCS